MMKYLIELILISFFLMAAGIGTFLIISLLKTAIVDHGINIKKIKLKGWY